MAHGKLQIKWAPKWGLLTIPLMLTLIGCDGEFAELPDIDPAPTSEVRDANPDQSSGSEVPPEGNKDSSQQAEQQPEEKPLPSNKVKIYWLTEKDTALDLVSSNYEVSSDDLSDEDKIQQTLERLLKGPANSNVSSAIPDGTTLNRVALKKDGIHVDLSRGFTEGGGSQSMQGRLGQIIYTASSLDSRMPVWISIDGEALEVLGGEGLIVSQPITRQEFDKNFSI